MMNNSKNLHRSRKDLKGIERSKESRESILIFLIISTVSSMLFDDPKRIPNQSMEMDSRKLLVIKDYDQSKQYYCHTCCHIFKVDQTSV